jgi:hypothetical protein
VPSLAPPEVALAHAARHGAVHLRLGQREQVVAHVSLHAARRESDFRNIVVHERFLHAALRNRLRRKVQQVANLHAAIPQRFCELVVLLARVHQVGMSSKTAAKDTAHEVFQRLSRAVQQHARPPDLAFNLMVIPSVPFLPKPTRHPQAGSLFYEYFLHIAVVFKRGRNIPQVKDFHRIFLFLSDFFKKCLLQQIYISA